MAHCALYLYVHLVFHINLGLSSAQVDNDNVDNDQHNEDPEDELAANTVVSILHRIFDVLQSLFHRFQWFLVKSLHALGGWVLERGTESVEHGKGLNLPSESLLVDNH